MIHRAYLQRSLVEVLLLDADKLRDDELRAIDPILDDEAIVELVPEAYHRALRWRTGSAGRISVAKRSHGLRRGRYRGLPGTAPWVGLGVIASNLRVLARAGPPRQPRDH